MRGRTLEISLFGNRVQVKIKYLIMGAVLLISAAMLIGFNLVDKDAGIIIDAAENSGADNTYKNGDSGLNENSDEAEEIPDIKVYVVGCVNKPGIVTLKRGQIIDDAIKAAGGATKEADLENINLAYVINSNLMLRIRAKSESEKPQSSIDSGSSVSNTAQIHGSSVAGSGALIFTGSGGAVVEEIPEKAKVNINIASVEELDTLPGIGEATAEAIVSFREQNGGFRKIEDIMKIPGIKQAKFDKIKDYISVN